MPRQEPENFSVEVVPNGKGGYSWIARGEVTEIYALEKEGKITSRMCATTRGFQPFTSKDGKATIIFNANVSLPKPRTGRDGKASTAFRITRDANGNEVRTPV